MKRVVKNYVRLLHDSHIKDKSSNHLIFIFNSIKGSMQL